MWRQQCATCASTSLFLSYDYFSVVLIPWISSPQNHTNSIKEEREKMEKGQGGQLQPQMAAASVNVRLGSQQTSIYSLSQRGEEVA